MGFTIQRGGFTRTPELAYAILQDLLANGFTLSFPQSAPTAPVAGTAYAGFVATLHAGVTVDPLSASQPWRINIDSTKNSQQLDLVFASPAQLPNDGTVAVLNQSDYNSTTYSISGAMTVAPIAAGLLRTSDSLVPAPTPPLAQADNYANHFISRNCDKRITSDAVAINYPMTYTLSISDHGIALSVIEDASDANAIPCASWLVVQRLVNRSTGAVKVDGKSPVVCLFSLKNRPFKFIVREADVLKPTLPIRADIHSPDSRAVINVTKQVAITENNRYVLSFPNGINTARYMYTEEIDMLAYTSADVISMNAIVALSVYGEPAPRSFRAMNASLGDNQGVRVLLLVAGGGV